MWAESVSAKIDGQVLTRCLGNANRYPGVACDVPSHSYQFSFAENTQWSAYYAPGREIHQYLRNVASQYDLNKYIKVSWERVRDRTLDLTP
jgi:cation diffusion facilitator CzcD-associated flavoprotein CzcO